MFVLLGLSAVFPVLHGIELYGIDEMRDRMGLTWVVLQGFLYILGAGLYAVSELKLHDMANADCPFFLSFGGPKDRGLDLLIFGEAPIRYFMCLWYWRLHPICMD